MRKLKEIKRCEESTPQVLRISRRNSYALLSTLTFHCAMLFPLLFTCLLTSNVINAETKHSSSKWQYKCNAGHCEKSEIGENDTAPQSLAVCQLFCGSAGVLWPMPTGHLSLGNNVADLNPEDITLSGLNDLSKTGQLLTTNIDRVKKTLYKHKARAGGVGLVIHFKIINENASEVKLTLNTIENYTLSIGQQEDEKVHATINADNYFGARHAIETLSQLIVYDDLNDHLKIVREAHVEDGPVYPYRGIALDTSRNYIDKNTILRTIEAMGMSKLNTLHWHITDTHSFPYVSKTWPLLSQYGAYSARKVYTSEDIKEIIMFGLLNGVRILPELDAPAHVGEGWQWVGDNATVCFNKKPWRNYCLEPPCGQLNPTSEKVYEILEGIYSDMIEDFQPDLFHMGGDEVQINCWNSSEQIKDWMIKKGWNLTDNDYYKLWDYFQTRAYQKLTKANKGQKITAILWTSHLTDENYLKHLDPEQYIIQVWTNSHDPVIKKLLDKKYKIIISNQDALYLDCGFSSWIGEGNNNWCSPYKGWQKIYQNSPKAIIKSLNVTNFERDQVLGSEVALWSEQVEGPAIDTKLWPRAAAIAERTWSEPDSSWHHAMNRFLWHRERLAMKGIIADAQQPEWCIQNQGACI